MSKINKKGVELIGIINRVGNNAIVECKCPICNNTFTMYRSHFYRGSNACKCKSPKNDRIYSIWINMKTRCYNNNSPNSKYYLNKGITICESWFTLKELSRYLNISYKTLTSYYYRNGKDKLIQYINRKIKHLDQ